MKFKRANVGIEGIIIILILVIFGITSIVLSLLANNVTDMIIEGDEFNAESKDIAHSFRYDFPTWTDNAFILAVIILYIGTIISAVFIDAHPVFLVFAIILMVVVIAIGGWISNFYIEFSTSEGIISVVADYPKTNFVLSKLPIFGLLYGITLMVVLYAKTR